MAKQMVNPIERHVEKLVVGVAAMILVGAVALYLVTSPNKVDMGGQSVTPKTVDAAVAERATGILAKLRGQPPETPVPEPLADDFAASLAPLEGTKLALAAPLGPPVPLLDAAITIGGKVSLVEVVRPEKIGVTHGRSTIEARGADGQVKYRPVNWATVSAVFDFKQQIELQKRTYGAKWEELALASPELQRRTQRADGTWSDEDWQDVTPAPGMPMPPLPRIEFEENRDGSVAASTQSVQELGNFLRQMGDLKYQRELLRPLMHVVVNGDEWEFPVLTSYPDVLKQDDDYLNPDGQMSQTDLYGLAAAVDTTGPKTAVVAKDPVDAALDEIKALLDRARKERVHEAAIQAFNNALDLSNNTTVSASQKQRALKLKDEANQLEQDIAREKKLGTGPKPTDKTGPAARQRQPIQQVWAHDAADGSLKDGHTYQFRIRCRIVNTLAADAAKFDNPEDAAKVVLTSAWSDPTEPLTFEPSSLFFVTYEDRSKKLVGVEFFRWYLGVWLESRRENFGVGQILSTRQRHKAPSLDNPEQVDTPEIEWTGDGTVVDIDFGRDMLERKTTRGSEGVTFGAPKKETAVVYMDLEGGLHERFVSLDKEHPKKREATARLWTPKAKP